MYGLLSIVSHHSVFKYFVIKIISTNPVKPMMFFFLLKGENDFLQPRVSCDCACNPQEIQTNKYHLLTNTPWITRHYECCSPREGEVE